MTHHADKFTGSKSWFRTADTFIFICCLCVIALRATITEGAKVQTVLSAFNTTDNFYSIFICGVLLLLFSAWLIIWCLDKKKFKASLTEIGLVIFFAAGTVSFFAASNKRIAIADFCTLVSPIFMSIMLIQILDRPKIKILLAVIISLGAVNAYKCINQYFTESKYIIQQYENDPNSLLKPLGIEPDSFNNFLFENRIYSKDISGYFTTGNSAGSFAILAIFSAIAAFMLKRPKDYRIAAVAALIIAGLILTCSKGAISSAVILGVCFGLFCRMKAFITKHKISISTSLFILILIIFGSFIYYGIQNGRLPGGNSMLVRWEYWQASIQMVKEHFWSGVGGGNFVEYYFHFKPGQSIETINDPHNFILRILTEYGIIGIVGFLIILLMPLITLILKKNKIQPQPDENIQSNKQAVLSSLFVAAGMILLRPMFFSLYQSTEISAVLYAHTMIYLAPVAVFLIAFWLGWKEISQQSADSKINLITAALICGLCGVLLHSMIDYAFFEAGVYTVFWAIFASIIALNRKQQHQENKNILLRTAAVIIILSGFGAFMIFAVIPSARTTFRIQQAIKNISSADILLQTADSEDAFDPKPMSLKASLNIQSYLISQDKSTDYLIKARDSLKRAISKDPADFKNYESLMETYLFMGEFENAFAASKQAVERYPNSDRLRFNLAILAEKNNDSETAILEYQKVIDIEDSYRKEFMKMYPGKKIFSRLGEQKYETAKDRVKVLKQKPQN